MTEIMNCCRSCLSNKTEYNIFSLYFDDFEKLLSDIFIEITNIELDENNERLPQFLCSNCFYSLKSAYEFKIQCKKTDEELKTNIKLEEDLTFFEIETLDNIEEEHLDDYDGDDDNHININYGEDLISEVDDGSDGGDDEDDSKSNEIQEVIYEEEIEIIDDLNCEICGHIAETYDELETHYAKHQRQPMPCTICNKNILNVREHMKKHAEIMKSYSEDNFKKNINSCVCKVCGKKFKSSNSLKRHIGIHKEIEQLECKLCNGIFANNKLLERHMKTHTNVICPICGKSLKSVRYLKNHMNVIHRQNKKYECEICHKLFIRQDSLKTHNLIHTGEKPHKCDICGKSFSQRNSLITHSFLHTGKKIECKICGKLFARPSNLILHNREHTGEKPYVCNQCGKTFKQKSHLSGHLLTHLDTRQFKCDICGNEYTQKSTLTIHMYKHTGPPIKCEFCPSSFYKKVQYCNHLKTHHSNIKIEEIDAE